MSSLHSDLYKYQLNFGNQVTQTGQGEGETVMLLKRDKTTNAMVDHMAIKGHLNDKTAGDDPLPPDALFEFTFHEDLITAAQLRRASAARYEMPSGTMTFKIMPPSPVPPYGTYRFWRLWLAPSEMS